MKFICLKLLLLFALLLPAGAQQGNFVKISTETYEVIYPTNFWLKNRTNIWVEIEGFITSGSGGSNSFGVNNTFYTPWNYTNSAEIEHTVTGLTNFSSSIVANSISTNKIDSTFRNWVTSMGSSGSGVTVNGLTATNFWDNGYITFLDAGGGDWSLNIGNDTISTNKINSTFYNWVLSLAGGGGGTTNGLGVNGTFRTDWNAINSAEIAYTVSSGTNWYGSLIANSVAANKLGTTGTGTSTNFLAGDYSYKQVTTNMIPGLNAILATIGSGGGGTNYTQFWYDLTNSVVSSNNISLAYDNTNKKLLISASTGGTNSGTAVTVDGGADNVRINLADSTGIGASLSGTNASFALVDRNFGSVTVSGSGTTITYNNNSISSNHIAAGQVSQDKLGTSGTGLSTNFLAGDYSYKQVTTNMIPGLNAILATIGTGGGSGTGTVVTANGGSDMSRANITTNGFGLLVTQSGTNVQLSLTNNYPVDYYAGGFLPLYAGLSNSLTGNLHYKKSSDIRSPMWESGTEWNAMGMRANAGVWSVAEYNTNDFTVLESFITIDPTDLTGPTDVVRFPNSGFNNQVIFDADVTFNGTVTGGGLTEAQASLLYQRTNSTLTRLAGIGSGSQGDIVYRDANGWTNFAKGSTGQFLAATSTGLAFSNAPSGSGLTDGGTIGSGTITRFTTTTINSLDYYNIENGDSFCDGDQWTGSAFIFFPTYVGSALASGTVDGIAATTNNPSYSSLAASASANSGWAYLTDASAIDIGGGGHRHFSTVSVAATNNIVYRSGFFDSATAPVDGAYIRMVNGFAQGVLVNNSSETVTTSSNQMSISSTTFVRFVSQVNTDAASCTFFVLTPSTPGTWTTNWTASVTNTLPTGSSRLTGFGFAAYHTSGSSGTVIARLDNLSKRTLRILNR